MGTHPKLKRMTADEFVKNLLSGERDFRYISLPPYSNLSRFKEYVDGILAGKRTGQARQNKWIWRKPRSWEYEELQAYLRKQDFEKNPIDVSDSDLPGLFVDGLYLPYLKGVNTNFEEANFDLSFIPKSILDKAKCKKAYFMSTVAVASSHRETDLTGAVSINTAYQQSDFYQTIVYGTIFHVADLRDVRNLEDVVDLDCAVFKDTLVTEKEAEIINRLLKKVNRLKVM